MPGEHRKSEWLARWRARRQSKRHRTVMEKLFGAVEEDSDEKIVQRHTNSGRELDAEDRRYNIKGGAGGGLQ